MRSYLNRFGNYLLSRFKATCRTVIAFWEAYQNALWFFFVAIAFLLTIYLAATEDLRSWAMTFAAIMAFFGLVWWNHDRTEMAESKSDREWEHDVAEQNRRKSFDYVWSVIDELSDAVRAWIVKIPRDYQQEFDYSTLSQPERNEIQRLQQKISGLVGTIYCSHFASEQIAKLRAFLLNTPWFLIPPLSYEMIAALGITEDELDERRIIAEKALGPAEFTEVGCTTND